ncbi:hypothetical protein [Streptomyces nanshensis]|uniref:Uncharacterized protein n=1 Tax=Streptomyces nanshensis TaxID=518642 RepID=A0A1E7LAI6_9ACTN|nr:hypothetical protein [Streptomyces nanshensis]OEV13209.1 hypothetical protein AN218_04645 [Streptomyces nanshensis]
MAKWTRIAKGQYELRDGEEILATAAKDRVYDAGFRGGEWWHVTVGGKEIAVQHETLTTAKRHAESLI